MSIKQIKLELNGGDNSRDVSSFTTLVYYKVQATEAMLCYMYYRLLRR